MFTLPVGYAKKKFYQVEYIGSNSNIVDLASSVAVPMPTDLQEGDTIILAGGGSQDSTISASVSGYTNLFTRNYTGITSNHFGVWYKIAGPSEGSATISFGGASNPKFGISMAFRWAHTTISTYNEGIGPTNSPLTLGSHTESDNYSMSVLVSWANCNGSTDMGVSAEPTDYLLASRVDGNVISAADSDRILSSWYRVFNNRGAQSPSYAVTPASSYDSLFANITIPLAPALVKS